MPRKVQRPAKLSPPRLHMAVPRGRLFELIDAGRDRPIVWMSGPPGAGKTTAVATYAGVSHSPCLWYQLDPGDADPATFFYYLRIAASALSTKRGRPLPLLTPEYGSDLSGFSRHCFRELFAGLRRSALVVFDNYQEVPTASLLHSLLESAFQEVPESANVIVISREPPPKVFARAVVNGTLASVGWEDLRLTLDETREIAAARLHSDKTAIQTLHQISNGWVAGVTLMLERLRRGGAVLETAARDPAEPVFDYFATQIFETVSLETRRLLMKTAFFPTFTVTLAQQMSGDENAGRILELLHRRRLFLDRREGTEAIYQYHAMFRAFLRDRADSELTPGEIRSLTSHAAELLAEQGNAEDAFGLYCDAERWSEASELLVAMAPALIGQGRWQTVKEWSSRLPRTVQLGNPWIDYWLAMALEPIEPRNARELLKRAFETFKDRGDDIGAMMSAAGILDTIYTEFASFVEMDYWIDVLAEFLQGSPVFPSLDAELRAHLSFLGVVYYQPGHWLLRDCANRVEALLKVSFDVNLKAVAGQRLAAYADATTDLDLFRRVAEEVDPLLDSPELSPANAARYLFIKGYDHYIAWQTDEAFSCLERARQIARRERLIDEEFKINVYLVNCARRARKMTLVDRTLAELEAARKPSNGVFVAVYEHAKALVAYSKGHVQLAIEGERVALQKLQGSGYVYAEVVFTSFNAMYLIAIGQLDAAARCLSHARALSVGTAIDAARAYIALNEAHIAHLRGDVQLRNNLLSEAVALGRSPSGIARLRWAPEAMSVLFPVALREDIESELVRSLIMELEVEPSPRDAQGWPWLISIHTLGGFYLIQQGEPITFSRKVPKRILELLKAIVALGGTNVSRQRLVDLYADKGDGDRANNSLEVAIGRLRRLLGSRDAVLVKGDSVSLNRRLCWLDIWSFEELLEQWTIRHRVATEDLLEHCSKVLGVYRGNFLAGDPDEAWTLQARSRLRAAFIDHMARLGAELERYARWDAAVQCYQRGLEVDDLAEPLYQGLMRAFLALRRPAEGVAVFRRLRHTLSVVLGMVPSVESEALAQSLRS